MLCFEVVNDIFSSLMRVLLCCILCKFQHIGPNMGNVYGFEVEYIMFVGVVSKLNSKPNIIWSFVLRDNY